MTTSDRQPWDEARAADRASLLAIGDELVRLCGHLNAANYRFLVLLAEWDQRKGWGGDGATASCAHWLNWKCGINMNAAREKVRTANALVNLPKIAAAMERGTLSYSKVRALTRVACPATEELLLQYALHATAEQIERIVRDFRRCKEVEELGREARQQTDRRLTWYHDDDGMLVIKARLPAEAGQLFIKAIEAATEELPSQKVSAETSPITRPEQPSARQADALAMVAEAFLAHGPAALKGGDRHQIVVHVDAETLRNSTPGRCGFEHGPSMAAETARRLSCDCSIVPILENSDGEPLNVGRKTRSIPPALHRALMARDRACCRFPGCHNTRYLDGHHIKHWAHGGETKLSNLVSLCRFHHRRVHEGQVVVQVLDDGAIRFTTPEGQTFDSTLPDHTQPLGDWQQLVDAHEEAGLHIDHHTAVANLSWDGYDHGLAIEHLLFRWRGGPWKPSPPGLSGRVN